MTNFDDLIDYLEFLEFDQYIFVALAENDRLNRLANYLQEQLDMEIKVVNIESVDDYLESQNFMPARLARKRTASGKPRFSISMMKFTAPPPCLQPRRSGRFFTG